ncbi:MAG: DEAD/DEAH box helicase [Planctomycetota bacterium]|nr:MAG: DEAD/DEAH box helicase [Planctomycetota bacterium]
MQKSASACAKSPINREAAVGRYRHNHPTHPPASRMQIGGVTRHARRRILLDRRVCGNYGSEDCDWKAVDPQLASLAVRRSCRLRRNPLMTSEDNAPRPDAPKSSFADLGLKTEIINVLSGTHLDRPTPLQCDLLPRFLAGKDCFVLARSGAGKTNGFVLPIVQRIEPRGGVQALLISPTRSTALRI